MGWIVKNVQFVDRSGSAFVAVLLLECFLEGFVAEDKLHFRLIAVGRLHFAFATVAAEANFRTSD